MPGLYLIEVDDKGERSFSYWRDTSAAKAYFDAAVTPLEEALPSLDALYLSGISLAILPEAGRERLLAAMARLRAQGGTVIFDNNYRPRLWAERAVARDWFARACAQASIALITADDEQTLHALPSLDAAISHALALPCAEVVVKRGASSTVVRREGEPLREIPTVQVPRVVDTTAAGDSFAAGYLAVRLSGGGTVQAAALGNHLAAEVIQHRGALIPREAMAPLMRA
jgi:2-dehydro-3-deoxygluconokinase